MRTWLRRLERLPWLWKLVVWAPKSTGVTWDSLKLLEIMSRPWWLYRSGGRVPAAKIEVLAPRPVTEGDVALCDRLISAFRQGMGKSRVNAEPRGMWALIFDIHQRPLVDALERGDAHGLACLLASMFQEEFIFGITRGPLTRSNELPLASRILVLKSLDALVSLAEALGVVPVENPEQGKAGLAFDGGVAKLAARIEKALGFQLAFPDVGAPHGLRIAGELITTETPEQIYAALRLGQAMEVHMPQRAQGAVTVVEIGGGYGGMCYWFLKMHPDIGNYTIVDLPAANILQGYFLAQALGPLKVSFIGEPPALVKVLPDTALDEVSTPFGILANKDSMPEMPREAMIDYLEWSCSNCDGFFYSYNQEAEDEFEGEAQGVVSHAVGQIGGFTRVRRDNSWLRRGYAEEIYTPTSLRHPDLATAS